MIGEQAECFTYLCDYVVAAHGILLGGPKTMSGRSADRAIASSGGPSRGRRDLARGPCVFTFHRSTLWQLTIDIPDVGACVLSGHTIYKL